MAFGPRYLSIRGEMPSGPNAFEFLAVLMALAVCSGVMFISGSVGFFLRFLRIFLVRCVGFLLVVGVNWLLNLLANFLGLLWILLLKLMPWLLGWLGLFVRFLTVDHSFLLLALHLLRCSFHFFLNVVSISNVQF